MRSRFIAASIAFALATGLSAAPGPKPDVGDGRVAWFDITTSNLQQSKEFYAKLFGWEYTSLAGSNYAVEIVSGASPSEPSASPRARSAPSTAWSTSR